MILVLVIAIRKRQGLGLDCHARGSSRIESMEAVEPCVQVAAAVKHVQGSNDVQVEKANHLATKTRHQADKGRSSLKSHVTNCLQN